METKVCPTCGVEKRLTQFKRGIIRRECRSCFRSARRAKGLCGVCGREAEGKANCEMCRAYYNEATVLSHKRRVEKGLCRRCGKQRSGDKWHCTDCVKLQNETRAKLRREVLDQYGGKCVFCGESREVFLTIDHVNNDGAAHRKEIGGGGHIYRWLRRNGYPQGFQVACCNCNWAKARIGETALRELLSTSQDH